MATPTIRTKVSLEGEKEYKQALSEINSGLRVLGSEMKLVSAQFADNENSIDGLTAKGSVLERQFLTQAEKVETLKAALQSSANAYGESDKRTQSWQISLNNAAAELAKMERSLKENQNALEQAAASAEAAQVAYNDVGDAMEEDGEKTEKFGELIEEFANRLGVSIPDGAKNALDALGDVDAKTAALATSATAAAAALVEIEKSLIDLTTDRAASATGLANIAETINMDVEATQQWDYVLRTVGSSIEEAQGDLSAFQEKIMDAATGTGEAAEMFGKLGVSVYDYDGTLRDTQSVLLDTIYALQTMRDETERNAISSTLLGGTGEKLIPIYNQSADALRYLLEKKKELGLMTGDELEALKDVSEALIDYEERTNSAKDTIAASFAPALAEFYEEAGKGVKRLGEAATDSGLVNFFGSLLEIVTALSPVLDILGRAVELLAPQFYALSIGISAVADGLSIVANLAGALLNLVTFDFGGAGENWDNIMEIFSGKSATGRAWNNVFNSSGDSNFRGGYTWVGENGPELAWIPHGSRIYNNQESRQMGSNVYYITIDAKNVREFNDIVRMAQKKRRTERMEE